MMVLLSNWADLDIYFKFMLGNSTENAIYIIYAIYSDVTIILDLKNKYFLSPYLSEIN